MTNPIVKYSSAKAMENLRAARFTRWPDGRKQSDRLGIFAKCGIQPTFTINPEDKIYTIGSCFAREIEKKLLQNGFDVPMTAVASDENGLRRDEMNSTSRAEILNKYVPQSMLNEIKWALTGQQPADDLLFFKASEKEDLWQDCHLHAALKPTSVARLRERRELVTQATRLLPQCRIIVMTLGLVEAWYDTHSELYLNGIPTNEAFSIYPERFQLHVLSYEDILSSLEEIHTLLTEHGHADFQILLTVSPVPFKASFTGQDALIANTYSKSVLRAVAEKFNSLHTNVNYFPSYETVTLSERTAAYTTDNIHIQEQMVERIVSQVLDAYVPGMAGTFNPSYATRPDATDARGLTERALTCAENGDFMQATKLIRLAMDTYGAGGLYNMNEFQARMTLAGNFERVLDYRSAVREYEEIVSTFSREAEAWFKYGKSLAKIKDFATASTAFTAYLRLTKEPAARAIGFYEMADVSKALRNWDLAEKHRKKADALSLSN